MSSRFSKKDGFTVLQGAEIKDTLAQRLLGPVNRLRDLYTRFGMRTYRMRIVRTRWSGGRRGVGGEEEIVFQHDFLPTPKIMDMGTLSQIANPTGLDEAGIVLVSEINGKTPEDILLGLDPEGREPLKSDHVFYEIEFMRVDGKPGERRRFNLAAAPDFRASQFQWVIQLKKADENRGRGGELR